MKDGPFSWEDPMSVIAFLPEFYSACHACGVHEGSKMWLFKNIRDRPSRGSSEGGNDVNELRQILSPGRIEVVLHHCQVSR